jgi:DeoR/GlpR family transcriptional regulator of sugar metabolism
MTATERRQRIIERIETEGSIAVADLSRRFAVSEMTIRRDLRALENEGLLRRVYGGAISARGRGYEPPYLVRAAKQGGDKQRIGQRAAELVYDGDSIALDVGTTTLEVARHLKGKQNLTIITASLPIANELVNHPGIRLIITGGILRDGELSMVGHLAERSLRDVHVDKAFVGIGGISLEAGLTEFNLEDALVKRAMIACAAECIVVADSSKFGCTAFAAVAPFSQVRTIVTDVGLGDEMVARLRAANIELILA